MDQDQKAILFAIIKTEIQKVNQKVLELNELLASVSPDDAVGRISRMDAINNNSVVEASLRNLNNRLEQLTLSLRIIDENDFGICVKCHQSIPFERLRLRPEIRFCANCMVR